MLNEDLNMWKLCSKMVLENFTQTNAKIDLRGLLSRFRSDGTNGMSRVIISDETWLFKYDLELRSQRVQW